MSKLEKYMNEARNLNSDFARIKKIFTLYIKKEEELKTKMFLDIENIFVSISKSINKMDFEKFIQTLTIRLIDFPKLDIQNDVRKIGKDIMKDME